MGPFAGIVACDEECYATFAELFDPVIERLHAGFSSTAKHPMDNNPSKFSNAQIDPRGVCASSVRVELRRNLSGLKMPTACEQSERREVERIVTTALNSLGGSWEGEYMPLTWSQSYSAKSSGMSAEDQAQLRDDGLLFMEPTAPARLAMGLGRHWPDARGIFLAKRRDCFAWCNEEDHLCLVVNLQGADLKAAVARAEEAAAAVEAEARKTGSGYVKDDRLGFLTVNPANLGNGCSCSVSLRIPNLGKHKQFSAVCKALEFRASWRAGAWDIACVPSLGVSQVDLITGVIEGCSMLVSLEGKLEQGKSIDEDLRSLSASKGIA